MRFLKNKIAKANSFQSQMNQDTVKMEETLQELSLNKNNSPKQAQPKKRKRVPGFSITPESSRATKNIVKNFGKAICNFSTSKFALTYLTPIAERQRVKVEDFINYVNDIKKKIDGLYRFRYILLENKNDDSLTSALKAVFKEISEVFIKYFSVNWIFHSKILHKKAHLKFRFKMLRRIKTPELFTYLRTSEDSKENKEPSVEIKEEF